MEWLSSLFENPHFVSGHKSLGLWHGPDASEADVAAEPLSKSRQRLAVMRHAASQSRARHSATRLERACGASVAHYEIFPHILRWGSCYFLDASYSSSSLLFPPPLLSELLILRLARAQTYSYSDLLILRPTHTQT
eukprot:1680950-Pyramimonas_sp.AAC.1